MHTLIYGPAYLDISIETTRRLIAGDPPITIDQSLPATRMEPRDDGLLVLQGANGDRLTFSLPESAATYTLAEPVLARLLGPSTTRTVISEYPVVASARQLGGMGAGYANALSGTLRAPFGGTREHPDAVASEVLRLLAEHAIAVIPRFLPGCASDSSLVLLSRQGDKLAVGVREAMVHWTVDAEDRPLVERADALVFCGAPNALMREILTWRPALPVMCAPAMRNVCETGAPLSAMASGIDYLALNALEWEHLDGKAQLLRDVPVISVTDGPRGSRAFFHAGQERFFPAFPYSGPANSNRAGETYASTFFKVLLRAYPDGLRGRRISEDLIARAGQLATRQAARQLAITAFAFPPDDWVDALS